MTEDFTRRHTRAEITAKLVENDVPVAAIQSMQEVVQNDYLRERGALLTVDDGIGGTFTLPANSSWIQKPAHALRVPRLGEQRDQVLGSELGLTANEINELEGTGAFGPRTTHAEGSGVSLSANPAVGD